MNKKTIFIAAVLFLFHFQLKAQEYYRVYPWESLQRGWIEGAVRNVSTFSSDGKVKYNDQDYDKEGMQLTSAE